MQKAGGSQAGALPSRFASRGSGMFPVEAGSLPNLPQQLAAGSVLTNALPPQSVSKITQNNLVADKAQSGGSLRLFALIITINTYQHGEIQNLTGSVNDGDAFQELLTSKLGVPPAHILRLSDEHATRERILQSFKAHLIDNENIRRGDAIVFFYAGHGSRVEAHPSWLARDDFVETIVPHDEGGVNSKGEHIYGIPDRTFDGLMRVLASKKGDNITAIFDSCHSGGIGRGSNDPTFRPRVLLSNVSPHPLPERLDEEIWQWGLSPRSATTVVPVGFLYKAMTSHILLAACRQEELAFETRDTPSHGAFTVALVEALSTQSLANLSYEQLAELLMLPSLETRQHPQCEGINKNRVLFNASELIDRSHSFKVTKRKEDGRLVLDAGGIHGIVEGTKFRVAVERSDAASEHNALLSSIMFASTGVQALQSFLVPNLPTTLPHELRDFRATVTDWNTLLVTVRFLGPAGSYHSTLTSSGHSDISVQCGEGDMLQIRRHDPLTTKYHKARALEVSNGHLSRILDGISRFNVHLYRRNPHTPTKGHFDVQLHQVDAKADTGLRPVLTPVGEDFFGNATEDVICSEESSLQIDTVKHAVVTNMDVYYGLTLINTSDNDLFPYVFYFDPNDCSVQSWYLPHARNMAPPLPRGTQERPSTLHVGFASEGTDSLEFSIPEGANADTGFLKVFLSTSYVDMKHIEQEAVVGPTAPRAVKKTRNLDVFKDDWDEWVGVLTCMRPA